MALGLKITFVQKGIGFGGLAAKLPAAIAAGLNEGGGKVRTQVQLSLLKQTGAKEMSSITRRIRVGPASGGALAYRIVAAGRPVMGIKEFKWSNTGKGITAAVWGVDRLFKRSFLLNGVPMARRGSERYPIRTLYGPNLAKELTRGATPSVFIFSARAFVPPAILKHIKGAI